MVNAVTSAKFRFAAHIARHPKTRQTWIAPTCSAVSAHNTVGKGHWSCMLDKSPKPKQGFCRLGASRSRWSRLEGTRETYFFCLPFLCRVDTVVMRFTPSSLRGLSFGCLRERCRDRDRDQEKEENQDTLKCTHVLRGISWLADTRRIAPTKSLTLSTGSRSHDNHLRPVLMFSRDVRNFATTSLRKHQSHLDHSPGSPVALWFMCTSEAPACVHVSGIDS